MQKKMFLGLIVFVMVMAFACTMSDPEKDFTFEPLDGGKSVMITGYVGTKWEVRIPLKIRKLPVTHIGEGSFSGKNLTSVTIPNGVTTIGNGAFSGNQLTSIIIPDSVTTIGDNAFMGNQITSITIPNSVTYLSGFSGNQLTSVTIPDSVNSIGYKAFSNNQLTNVTIPKSVYSIGNDSFSGNFLTDGYDFDIFFFDYDIKIIAITNYWGASKDIIIPESIIGLPVTLIGEKAFYKKDLTSVTIPNSVTSIGELAFGENQLADVIIPNSVASIGPYAFHRNKLASVTIPNSITNIAGYTFAGNQLTSVIIPDSVTTIRDNAFWSGSNRLISITIGTNVWFWSETASGLGETFHDVYVRGGRQAGTYTRPNTSSRTWTRQ